MARTCPSCKSRNARRSSVRASEITLRHIFLSPYRCRECRTRFWVLSRNAYYFAGIIAVAIAIGAVGWNAGAWFEHSAPRRGPGRGRHAARRRPDQARQGQRRRSPSTSSPACTAAVIGVPKSATEEHSWLQRSARHGNVQAQYELGIALRDGHGTVQDYEEARKWLQRAAEGGNAKAQYALGLMYRTGMGVPVDNLKAYIWLNRRRRPGGAGRRLGARYRAGRASPRPSCWRRRPKRVG